CDTEMQSDCASHTTTRHSGLTTIDVVRRQFCCKCVCDCPSVDASFCIVKYAIFFRAITATFYINQRASYKCPGNLRLGSNDLLLQQREIRKNNFSAAQKTWQLVSGSSVPKK